MTTVDDLHFRLLVIGLLLKTAADDLRDADVAPVSDNVRNIGRALACLHDVLRSIQTGRPDLTPAAFPRLPPEAEG
jgi:hypothetical protein